MRKSTILILVGLLIATGGSLFGQKLKSGSFSALKGQSEINLQYDYSNMAVGKFKKEADYIAKRSKDINKKDDGAGDTWAKAWINDRSDRFQPTFEKNFNSKTGKCEITGKEGVEVKFTLIVKTLFTEPGMNVGVMRKNAYINMVVELVETANQETIIGKAELKNIQSVNMGGYDFDTGTRIQSCYDRAGDKFGSFVCKYIDK